MTKDPGNFLSNARTLMQKTDAKLGAPMKKRQNGQGEYDEGLLFEQSLYQGAGSYDTFSQPSYDGNQTINPSARKMPSEIYESMIGNPIDTGQEGLSVLDRYMPNIQTQTPQQNRRVITEDYDDGEKYMPTVDEIFRQKRPQYTPQQQYAQPQPQQNSPIDYSIIRMMIKEAVAEEFSKLQKTMTNSMIIKLGKEMQLVDSSGNVFKGDLRKVGNLNKK